MLCKAFNMVRKLILLFLFAPLSAEIIVDGKLNETEWDSAGVIDTFYVTEPLTYAIPEVETEVLYFANEDGIYFGFKNFQQPIEDQTSLLHKRDVMDASADRAFIAIDFNGNGIRAYSFSVTLGGSISDAVWANENQPSLDWDAIWYVKTSQTDDAWFAEFMIPWDVAPLEDSDAEFIEVNVRTSRGYFLKNEWHGFPKINWTDTKFISRFHPIKIRNFAKNSSSEVDFFPYISVSQEEVTGEQENKIGGEIFWAIDSEKRLDVTLNPDFGQVESDDVIVSFDALETFYEDKRPFFTENQDLFQIRGRTSFLINTRRIGASPDYDCSSEIDESDCNSQRKTYSEIDLALKYTQTEADDEFGIFSAFERDGKYYKGRNFQSIRYRKSLDDLRIGYLLTYVDRPNISRAAQVHTMDFDYSFDEISRFSGTLSYSNIDSESTSTEGVALRGRVARNFTEKFSALWGFGIYDEGYDMNDMGYLDMRNFAETGITAIYKETNFSEESLIRSLTLDVNGGHQRSISGINGGAMAWISLNLDLKDFSSIDIFCECILSPGKDFVEARDHPDSPFIRRLGGYTLNMRYSAPRQKTFIPFIKIESSSGGYKFDNPSNSKRGEGWGFNIGANIKPSNDLDLNLALIRYDEYENWVKYEFDNVFGYYKKKKLSSSLSLGWIKDNIHELRIKAQFYSLTADDPDPYYVSSDGKMINYDGSLNPFELSQVAFQIRYRYELSPLSNFYAVYTRGGYYFDDDKDLKSFGDLYSTGWDATYSDQFILKLRYKF